MDNNVIKYRNKILHKIGLDKFEGNKILDVGCGDGGDAQLISQYAKFTIGIDNQEHTDWKTKKSEVLHFQIADACNLPFRNSAFDTVFVKDALHHIETHDKALSEMIRVCRTGGKIIIAEANRYNPISYINMTLLRGHQHFTKKYFRNLISVQAKNVSFTSLESRVWPYDNNLFLGCFNFFEWWMGKITFLNNYNLAVITKI